MTEKQLKMRSLGFEACYLSCCALQGITPELDAQTDLDALYRFCKFHSITSIVAMSLDTVWKDQPADEQIMKKWRQARDQVIRKNIMLNAERQRILGFLESIGCWYMPLKGSLLQFAYPRFGMRQMSDNDILYDENKTREVYDFMTGSGYECPNFGMGKDDEYIKKPLYNIEMHRSLFGEALYPELAEYYRDVKSRLVKDDDNRFGYHFTHEDFYIYMVTHAFKHYIHGGIGIRNLLDIHVYVQQHGDSMDWDYTEQELRSLGAWEFDVSCRNLGRKLLLEPCRTVLLTEAEQRDLDIFFSSGTFGTEQQAVEKKLEKSSGSKLGYILKRMFPTMAYMKEREPVLRQKPWLAPWYYLKRFFSVLFGRREAVARELKNLNKTKTK